MPSRFLNELARLLFERSEENHSRPKIPVCGISEVYGIGAGDVLPSDEQGETLVVRTACKTRQPGITKNQF